MLENEILVIMFRALRVPLHLQLSQGCSYVHVYYFHCTCACNCVALRRSREPGLTYKIDKSYIQKTLRIFIPHYQKFATFRSRDDLCLRLSLKPKQHAHWRQIAKTTCTNFTSFTSQSSLDP